MSSDERRVRGLFALTGFLGAADRGLTGDGDLRVFSAEAQDVGERRADGGDGVATVPFLADGASEYLESFLRTNGGECSRTGVGVPGRLSCR